MPENRLENNIKRPSAAHVLHGIILSMGKKEFTSLSWLSRCGKSTVCRIFSVLDVVSDGKTFLVARKDFDREKHFRIQRRMGGHHGQRHVTGDPANYLYTVCIPTNYYRYDRRCGERIDR